MSYIDTSTIPNCKIEEKRFEWGEPYKIYSPIFYLTSQSTSKLKNSIILFGENNFKKQLLMIYNVLNNYDEFDKIESYEEKEDFNREEILALIIFYINKNENLMAPWEKYEIGLNEDDYFTYFKEKITDNLYSVKNV